MRSLPENETAFFVIGGTLPLEASSYVVRQADTDLYAALTQGEYAYLLNTRQMGKSSLVVRTAERLRREQGATVAIFELAAIGQNLSPEQWYYGLTNLLGQQVRLEDELDDFWFENELLSPMQRFFEGIRRILLPRISNRLIIIVDEVDVVRTVQKNFSTDEFFGGIRDCYNRRATQPEYEKLVFCLVGVATPADLITDTRVSPFNIGQRIVITDFTEPESLVLAQGLNKTGSMGKALLHRILYWTNGHPYLTQRLCREMADRSAPTPADVDAACERLFLSKTARETDNNLTFVRDRLLRSEFQVEDVLDLYAKVRSGKRVHDDETNPLYSVLRLSGIAKVVDHRGRLAIRNRIYERVFGADWIRENMPGAELRRQEAAARRGRLQVGALASVIISVMGSLYWQRVEAEDKISQQAEELREQTVRLQAQTVSLDKARRAAEKETQKAREAERNEKTAARNAREQEQKARQEAEKARQAEYQATIAKNDANAAADRASQEARNAETARKRAETLRKIADAKTEQVEAEKENVEKQKNLVKAERDRANMERDRANSETEEANRQKRIAQEKTRDAEKAAIAAKEAENTARVAEENALRAANEAKVAAQREKDAAEVAETARRRAERWAYIGRIVLAQQAYENGNSARAFELLSSLKENEYRGFEWGYLYNACQQKTTKLQNLGLTGLRALTYTGEGRELRLVNREGQFGVYNLDSGQVRVNKQRHSGSAFAISPNKNYLAVGDSNGDVLVYSLSSGESVATLSTGNRRITALTFNSKEHLVAVNEIGEVTRFETRQFFDKQTFSTGLRTVRAVALSEQNDLCVLAAGDTLTLWRRQSKEGEIREHKGRIIGVALSPDGKKVATICEDNTVQVFSTENRTRISGPTPLPGELGQPGAIAFSPDGMQLAVGGISGAVVLLTDTDKMFESRDSICAVRFAPDGQAVLMGNGRGEIIRYIPDNKGGIPTNPTKHSGRVLIATSSNREYWVAGWDDGGVELYRNDGKIARNIRPRERDNPVEALALSPDGNYVAIGRRNGTLELQNTREERKVWNYAGLHNNGILCLAFAPDSQTLMSGGRDGRVLRISTTGKEPRPFPIERENRERKPESVTAIAISPNGEHLAVAGESKEITVWDRATQRFLFACQGHSNRISNLAYSPDGKRLLSSSYDNTVKVWDAEPRNNGDLIVSLEGKLYWRDTRPILSLAVSPDGTALLVGMEDERGRNRGRAALLRAPLVAGSQ